MLFFYLFVCVCLFVLSVFVDVLFVHLCLFVAGLLCAFVFVFAFACLTQKKSTHKAKHKGITTTRNTSKQHKPNREQDNAKQNKATPQTTSIERERHREQRWWVFWNRKWAQQHGANERVCISIVFAWFVRCWLLYVFLVFAMCVLLGVCDSLFLLCACLFVCLFVGWFVVCVVVCLLCPLWLMYFFVFCLGCCVFLLIVRKQKRNNKQSKTNTPTHTWNNKITTKHKTHKRNTNTAKKLVVRLFVFLCLCMFVCFVCLVAGVLFVCVACVIYMCLFMLFCFWCVLCVFVCVCYLSHNKTSKNTKQTQT